MIKNCKKYLLFLLPVIHFSRTTKNVICGISVLAAMANSVSGQVISQDITNNMHRKVSDTNVVLPPCWAFGVLYGGYTNQEETINRIEEIKKHNYPIDAYWIDSWFWSYKDHGLGPQKYIDFIADTVSYPNRSAMWSYLQNNGIKGGFWTWDCILETGNETAFNEFKQQGFLSSVYNNTNSWHNLSTTTAMFEDSAKSKGTLCGNIDFDKPEAVAFFKQKMKHFFDEGADFIKLDRTSKISTTKAMFEMSQQFGKETKGRGFMLSHTGGMETEEYKKYPAKWTDDTRSDWTVEKPLVEFNNWVPKVALKENIAMYTDTFKASSRIPFLTNDMGGFDMGKTNMPEEELFIRWLQFSMFSPITEIFSQPENPTSNLAWKYSKRADSIFRFYAQYRMQLFPYIYSYAHLSRIDATPMIRKIPGQLYQYMFGDELLVAPVYEKGTTMQKVFLPEGKWINYWTGEEYVGNAEQMVNTLLDQIPLFVKQGSIIPMRQYTSAIEKGNNNLLTLNIYPGNDGQFDLIEDDGSSNDYLNGMYAETKINLLDDGKEIVLAINPVVGAYTGMKKNRKWILKVYGNKQVECCLLNGKKISFSNLKEQNAIEVKTRNISVKNLNKFIFVLSK